MGDYYRDQFIYKRSKIAGRSEDPSNECGRRVALICGEAGNEGKVIVTLDSYMHEFGMKSCPHARDS